MTPREQMLEAAQVLQRASARGIARSDYATLIEAYEVPPLAQHMAWQWFERAARCRVAYVRGPVRQRHKLVAPQVVKPRPQFKRAR